MSTFSIFPDVHHFVWSSHSLSLSLCPFFFQSAIGVPSARNYALVFCSRCILVMREERKWKEVNVNRDLREMNTVLYPPAGTAGTAFYGKLNHIKIHGSICSLNYLEV